MKKTYLLLLSYFIIMAIGLAYCNFYLNVQYAAPTFVSKFLPFLSILCIIVTLYYALQKNQLALQITGKQKYFLFMLPFIPVVFVGGISIIYGFEPSTKFALPLLSTLLIGIAEETMFRRILLGTFLRKYPITKSIILSAVVFSLLHALNFLGGQSLNQVAAQLMITFLVGLFFGAMYISTKNIYLLMIYHWLWDYIAFSNILEKIQILAVILPVVIVYEIIIAMLMLRKYSKNVDIRSK